MLTRRSIETLKPAAKPWIAWDTKLTGFGIRIQPSGIRSFIVNYRAGSGGRKARNRRVVIGRYGTIAPEGARRLAQELLGRVAVGRDPAAERAEARGIPALDEAFAEYLGANPNRKESTERLYRGQMRYCFGDWAARPLDSISRRDVETRFHRITERNGRATGNHAISLLRSVYRRPCVDFEGLRNPVELWIAGGGRYHPNVRRRISAPSEVLPRWRAGIEKEVTVPLTRDIFWFGMYTGMRVGEVFGLRWDRVDLAHRVLRVEETKTGEPLELPITRQLAAVLDRRRAEAGNGAARPAGWVFPSPTQRVGPRGGTAAPVPPHLPHRRDEVLVPRVAQLLHHGGGARTHAAALAHETVGESRPPRRCDRGLRCRLDHRAASRAGAAHRGPD